MKYGSVSYITTVDKYIFNIYTLKRHGNELSPFENAQTNCLTAPQTVGKYLSELLTCELLFLLRHEDRPNLQPSQVCLQHDPINSHLISNNQFYCIQLLMVLTEHFSWWC